MERPDYCSNESLKSIFAQIFKCLLDGNNAFTEQIDMIQKDGFDLKSLSRLSLTGKSYWSSGSPTKYSQTLYGNGTLIRVTLRTEVHHSAGVYPRTYFWSNRFWLAVDLEDSALLSATRLNRQKSILGAFCAETDGPKQYDSSACSFHDFVVQQLYTPLANSASTHAHWAGYLQRIRQFHKDTSKYI